MANKKRHPAKGSKRPPMKSSSPKKGAKNRYYVGGQMF